MPNWVQSYVEFSGNQDNIEKVFNEIKRSDSEASDERIFDFNRLVPMPTALNVESSSTSSLAYAYYMVKKFGQVPPDSYMDKQTILDRVEKNINVSTMEMFNLGKRQKENVDKYGATNWYDWCCRYWGTKWNACDVSRSDNTLWFQTAWSWPEPIMDKLAEICAKYNVEFEGKWADEDCGSNTGEFSSEKGKLTYEYFDLCSRAYQIYEYCWGESDCIGTDDEGEYYHYECERGSCPHYADCYGVDEEREVEAS